MSSTLTIRGFWHSDKIQYSLETSEEDSHLPKGVSPFTLSKGLRPLQLMNTCGAYQSITIHISLQHPSVSTHKCL